MHVEISRLLVAERVDRLRDAALAPPGPLAMLVLRLLNRGREPAVGEAWIARSTAAHEQERIAA
jgi:hypothetical protein